jgi:serine/threonine protein phosphatase PrpC
LVTSQIDTELINGRGLLLAVMDGHGGDTVADLIAANIESRFLKELDQAEGDVVSSLKFMIRDFVEETENSIDGSTLSVVYISEPQDSGDTEIVTAVIGDSPVLIKPDNGELRISDEHNIAVNLQDAHRIRDNNRELYDRGVLSLGPRFLGVGTNFIQLTRSIGDSSFNGVLLREPSIQKHQIVGSYTVILASDGVVFDDKCERRLIYEQLASRAEPESCTAESLVDWTLAQGADDNVTLILYKS